MIDLETSAPVEDVSVDPVSAEVISISSPEAMLIIPAGPEDDPDVSTPVQVSSVSPDVFEAVINSSAGAASRDPAHSEVGPDLSDISEDWSHALVSAHVDSDSSARAEAVFNTSSRPEVSPRHPVSAKVIFSSSTEAVLVVPAGPVVLSMDPASAKAVYDTSTVPGDAPDDFTSTGVVFYSSSVTPEDACVIPAPVETMTSTSAVSEDVSTDPASAKVALVLSITPEDDPRGSTESEAAFRDSVSPEAFSLTIDVVVSCSKASLMYILGLSLTSMMVCCFRTTSMSQGLNDSSLNAIRIKVK